jgi:hypothetical protein
MLSDPDAELSDPRKTGRPMGGKPDRCCLSEASVGRKIVVANDCLTWPIANLETPRAPLLWVHSGSVRGAGMPRSSWTIVLAEKIEKMRFCGTRHSR